MKRPRPNQEYVVNLQGRQLVHAISALRARSKAIFEKEGDFEGGEWEDMAILQSVIDRLEAAIEQQTQGSGE
jgi:hypothetical protein